MLPDVALKRDRKACHFINLMEAFTLEDISITNYDKLTGRVRNFTPIDYAIITPLY